jgi:hypothetical protein
MRHIQLAGHLFELIKLAHVDDGIVKFCTYFHLNTMFM